MSLAEAIKAKKEGNLVSAENFLLAEIKNNADSIDLGSVQNSVSLL